MAGSERAEAGSAVVDFVLVTLLLVPLVLGIAQVGLVLHVRNTATAAAAEGARAAAPLGSTPEIGAERTRQMIRATLADRYADDVTASTTVRSGIPATEVVVRTRVPALGLFGPTVPLTVRGHAVREVAP
ncbi:TadE-like protein [Aeromicrobium marinum DSM 15272]|uniref:TadE-like protein n=1 Tax=Aeromicrobium marinum DSM 15272 TaxID=585531 RepID=E2SE72_9ACTN|nr:TadE/TadG family type IV pilus assembly protein [Aeromicrobium marinum]EFQ82799.1 TadE-like protein [Aeromicrobium marinum DSM 15272]